MAGGLVLSKTAQLGGRLVKTCVDRFDQAVETVRVLRPAIAFVLVVAPLALVLLALGVRGGPSALDWIDPVLVSWRLASAPAQALVGFDVVGSFAAWGLLMAVVTVLAARARVVTAVETLGVSISAEIATAAIKAVVGRDRPSAADVGDLLTTASYPSGHVVRAVIATGAVLVVIRLPGLLRVVAIGVGASVVVLMAVARVSGGAHHTSDVIAGGLLGAAILASWALVREARPSRARAPGWVS